MRWLLLVLVAGCTSANPHFHKGDLGTTEGPGFDAAMSTTSSSDGAVKLSTDAAVDPPVDAAVPPPCTDGDRTCSTVASELCTDGTYAVDRYCPLTSACSEGYCQAPPNATPCSTIDGTATETLCATSMGMGTGNVSCQPFVGNGMVVWDCAPAIGSGGAGKSCNSGYDCRSGICADHACFRACASSTECPQGTQCQDLSFDVEGVTVDTTGCVPQT